MKKMRRTRDERKKMNNIGKDENLDIAEHLSPVMAQKSNTKTIKASSNQKKTPFSKNYGGESQHQVTPL